jgi:hypothetical protein
MEMRSRNSALVAGVAVALVLSGAAPSPATSPPAGKLRFVELTDRPAGIMEVNAAGAILGWIGDSNGDMTPVLWRRLDAPTALPIFGWRLNNRGDVLGEDAYWRASDNTVHAIEHPTLRVRTADINDNRQVAGTLGGAAFRWQDGVFEPLTTPAGASGSAWRINNSGDVIGTMWSGAGMKPVLWRDGALIDLTPPGVGTAMARDINDRGQVIVNSDAGAFLWDRGRMTALPGWRGGGVTEARDISDAGDVVGAVGYTPALWRAGKVIRMGLPGWTGAAVAVNERGDVAGSLLLTGDSFWVRRAFLWRQGRTYYGASIEWDEVSVGITGLDGRGRIAGYYQDRRPRDHVGVWLVPLGRRPFPADIPG